MDTGERISLGLIVLAFLASIASIAFGFVIMFGVWALLVPPVIVLMAALSWVFGGLLDRWL